MKVNSAERSLIIGRPKEKFTIYMTYEVKKLFNELFAFRVMAGGKETKSDIICEAVKLMHKKEFNKLRKA